MIILSERALEFSKKASEAIRIIREVNEGHLPVVARRNLVMVRTILKGCLRQIDEILGVDGGRRS